MKLYPEQTLAAIAKIIDCKYSGADDFPVKGINEIHVVEEGDIVFVDHPKYYNKALNCAASIVIINQEVECPAGKALLFSDDPFRDFNKIIRHFSSNARSSEAIAPSATIGEDSIIHPNVAIGENCTIGNNSIIHPGVVLYNNVHVGNNVVIHANCVLGADAFYYKKRPEGYDKLITCGQVIIEDHVELGAGTTIDRGVTGNTKVGKGTKIDNQVMIGHDTVIGENCLFAAQVGIAGCVVIENNVTLWGQVGIASDLTIGEGAVILAQGGVNKTLKGNTTYFGSPVGEARKRMRELAAIKILPEIIKQL